MTELTIVMPSLNQAEYLEEAVRSVLTQVEVGELVVADGGSGDGSLTLLTALQREFGDRLSWHSEVDSGPAQAVNRAVSRARGRIIGWLNSDDLYVPGAAALALEAFRASPALVMLYGHGEFVDSDGRFIGRYPTLPPSTPVDGFKDGCFICQPTVFFLRETFFALGGLDEALGASFDFEMWIRFFRKHAGHIGFVDQVTAKSRMHSAAITSRERKRVAQEGLRVVSRHFGIAPPHWLLTFVDEVLAKHPDGSGNEHPGVTLERLFHESRVMIGADAVHELCERLALDARIELASDHMGISLYPDGWTAKRLEVRLRQPVGVPYTHLLVGGVHASPRCGPLRLEIRAPLDEVFRVEVRDCGDFQFELEIPSSEPGSIATFQITCLDTFVPAELDPSSTDRRVLGFRVRRCDPRIAAF